MMKKPILLSGILLSLLAACGDEVTEVIQSADDSGMAVVAAGDKLSECSKNNVGEMVFVSDSNAVFFCADGKWKNLNGKDGTDGKDGEASSSVDTIVVNNQDTLIVRDTLIIKDTISSVDTVVSSAKDTLITRDTVYLKDTIVIYDSTTVFDTTVVKDTLVLEYKPEYDTVTTEFLNQELLATGKYGILVDKRDNKVYRTIEIGSQTWMAQNLNYSDGGVTSYCYDNSADLCAKHGRLYNWVFVVNLSESYSTTRATTATGVDSILRYPAQGICPDGWHVPTSAEWITLSDYVSAYNTIYYNSEGVGTSLKTTSSEIIWTPSEGTAPGTDRYGFSGIPNGRISAGKYVDISVWSLWWSSSEQTATGVGGFNLSNAGNNLGQVNASKKDFRAVRCIKD